MTTDIITQHTIDFIVLDCADCSHPYHKGECATLRSECPDIPCLCDAIDYPPFYGLTCTECGQYVVREGRSEAESWAESHECAVHA